MAQNKILNIEPGYLTASAANILNGAISSLTGPVGFTPTQPYIIVTHVRIVNNDSSNHTVKFFKGATAGSAGGTEVFWPNGYTLSSGQFQDWYGKVRFDAADFLSGLADTGSKVTYNIDAEIGFS